MKTNYYQLQTTLIEHTLLKAVCHAMCSKVFVNIGTATVLCHLFTFFSNT